MWADRQDYGKSAGEADISAIHAVLLYRYSKRFHAQNLLTKPLIIFGQSLGGVVA